MIKIVESIQNLNLKGFFNALYNLLEEYEKEGSEVSIDEVVFAIENIYNYINEVKPEILSNDMLNQESLYLQEIKDENSKYTIDKAILDLKKFCRRNGIKF